ncbi:hypothetical protein GE061_004605 [Apolygus lucorum]|uniref:Uncharacterized protein n=1 Tax=Apolygus lucorum TaxID=248454 RepID=A0A8S9WZR8_APOLU|nr:hypothetical protein GE061_004605 [Apolygus lucorum]
MVPAKAFLATLLAELKGASYNLITPVEDIELEGVQADNIIAFDDKSATTLDGKKHEGDVDYANDYCVLSADSFRRPIGERYRSPIQQLEEGPGGGQRR